MWRNLAEIDSKSKETPLYRKTSRKESEEESFTGMGYDEIISDFVQQRKTNGFSGKSQDPPSSSAKKMTTSALNHQERLRQLDKTKQLGLKIRKIGVLIDLMQRLAQKGQWMESEQIMIEVLQRSEDGFVRDAIGYDGLLDGYRSAAIFYYHHALIWEAEEMYDRCVDVRARAEQYYANPYHSPPLTALLPKVQYQEELQRLQNLTQQMLQKMHEIIRSLMDTGNHTEAERYLRSALNKLRQINDTALYERRMLYMIDLVAILYEMQRVEEAWPIIKEAIDFSTKFLGQSHQYTGLAYSHYGLLLGSQRRLEDAEVALQQALRILQDCETASPLMIVQAMISVSDVQVLQFRLNDAEAMLTTAQTLHEETFGRESVQVQARLNEFSTEKGFSNLVRNVLSAFSDGRVEEALFGMESIANRSTQLFGCDHPETLKIHLHWAKLLLRCESVDGSFERAKCIAEEILPRMEVVFGPTDCDVTMDTCRTLSQSYVRLGRRSAAMRLIQRVVDTQTVLLGPGHPLTLDSKYGLFECLFQLGRLDEGQAVLGDFLQHMDGISPEGRDRILAVISPLLAFLKTKESRSEFLVGCAEKLLQNQQFEDAEFIFLEQLRLREEMYLEETQFRKHPAAAHRMNQRRLHHYLQNYKQPLSSTVSTANHVAILNCQQQQTDAGDNASSNLTIEDDFQAAAVAAAADLIRVKASEDTIWSNGVADKMDTSIVEEDERVEESCGSCGLEEGDEDGEGGGERRAGLVNHVDDYEREAETLRIESISDAARLAATRLVPNSVSIATAQHLARLMRFVGRASDAEYLAQQLVVLREEFWGPWDKRTADARLFVDFIRSPIHLTSMPTTNAVLGDSTPSPDTGGRRSCSEKEDDNSVDDDEDDDDVSSAVPTEFLSKQTSSARTITRNAAKPGKLTKVPSWISEESGEISHTRTNIAVLSQDSALHRLRHRYKMRLQPRKPQLPPGNNLVPFTLTPEQRSLKRMISKRARTLLDIGAPPVSATTVASCGNCLPCRVRQRRRNWAKIFRMFWIPIIFIRRVRILRSRLWH
jgi:tetratricopeptide (TPR) repeat protein